MAISRKPLKRPDFGRRLLPTLIDERAHSNHDRPYASIPLSNDPKDGFRDISYKKFANAINRCAGWLIDELGESHNFETLLYIGPQDMRYQILCIAAIKAGFVMLFSSPRNSLEAHLSLINETKAEKIITPSSEPPAVASIMKNQSMRKLIIAEQDALLDEAPADEVPFTKTFEEARMEPFLILHTSGSTGIPKAIIIRHGYTTTADAYSAAPGGSELVQRVGGRRLFNPFPPFHMAGIMWALPYVCWVDATIILPPPIPLTATLAHEILKHSNVTYATLMPSIIVDLAKNEDSLQQIAELDGIAYAGGPLPKETGDKLSGMTTVHASYGSTEMMAPPVKPKAPENWQYLHFDIEQSGIEFRRTAPSADTYELVVVRKPELDLLQAIFCTFPELDEYKTKDLFKPHPTEPDHWLYASRLDDIIVFSNGEKLNPVSMEGTVTSRCPDVTGCLVVGSNKFQGALLVEMKEPPQSEDDRGKAIDQIWPVVQEANKSAVAHGRIARDYILFTKANKPFPRAGKGTIQRARAVELYKDEIEAFYGGQSSSVKQETQHHLDLSTIEQSQASLQTYFQQELSLNDIKLDDDLFSYGVDSLQTITLVRAINESQMHDREKIEAKQVYEHPTIRKLAQSLHTSTRLHREDDEDLEAWVEMQQTFHDLTSHFGQMEKAYHSPSMTIPRLELRHLQNESPNSSDSATLVQDASSNSRPEKSAVENEDAYQAWKDVDFLASMLPPDAGQLAWRQVLASFLININTFGLVNSFGDFQAFYKANYLASYSESTISWIGTVQAALFLLGGVVAGPIFDRGYFNITLIASSITLVFSWMMLSLANRYYEIMLTQGILSGLCIGLLYIPSIALIPLFFKDRRGRALGLALSGGPIGGVLYSVIFRGALNSVGFGWATRIMGFLVLATLSIAILLVHPLDNRLRATSRRSFLDFQAFKEVPFLFFFITGFLIYCAWLVPYYLTPGFAQNLGVNPSTATYLIAVLNAAQFFGRIIPAWMCDYYNCGSWLLLLAQLATGILGLSWITIRTVGGFVEFQIFYGFVSGMTATLPAVVIPYICPNLAVLGTRMGMIYAAAGIGVLIGNPVALAASKPEQGHFLGAQLWMGLTALVGSGFFVVTARAAWKQKRGVDSTKVDPLTLKGDWEKVVGWKSGDAASQSGC